ncbi:MAG: helix-turn-helix transcriptional regulator [Clostridia bacterium]|nr:helix-turn-helix transcriptional regulator [Clostridia bacterium]
MKKPFFTSYSDVWIEHLKTYEKFDIPVQQYHEGYELFLVINGERTIFFGDNCYRMKRGDMAVIKPFELHTAESCDVEFYERYVINFNVDDFKCILSDNEIKLIFKDFNSNLLHFEEHEFNILYDSFKVADKMSKIKNPLSKKATMSAILTIIMQLKTIPMIPVSQAAYNISPDITDAINYINLHYKDNITLDILTDKLHISKFHFCRLFKETTGTTFLEYLNNVRLAHAHRLLADGKFTIQDIAQKSGFGSAAYFSRIFKRTYGMSPKEFKNKI